VGEVKIIVPRKILKVGKSLCFTIPSAVFPPDVFYAYLSGEAIVYSSEPPSETLFLTVKPRVQARFRNRTYYVLTVPAEYARALGITKGMHVHVEVSDGKLVLRKP